MDPDDQPGGKRSGGRRARRSSATPQSSATIPATAKEFRSWVLASAPLVEQTTSLDRIEVDKALTAIITVIPNILTIRVLTDPPEVKPLDGCTANVCLGRSGPGGKEPCYQDTNCPSQTTCMTQACDGEACVGHQCGTLTCTEQGCNANYCNNNACTNNECESMDSPGCSGQSPDCAAQVVAPCEGHSCPSDACEGFDCREHSCGTYLGGTPEEPTTPDGGGTPEEPTTPDGVGLRARVGSLAASAAWGEIVAAVAAAAPDSLARARKLQVTLTRTPK